MTVVIRMDTAQWAIDGSSNQPIYRQIAEQVRRFVAAGQLQVGERLPPVRQLAARFGINPMTVSRAYGLLVEEGLLLRRRGASLAVAPKEGRSGLTADARMRLLEARLHDVIREANDLGLAAGPVCERLHALFLTPGAEKARSPRRGKRATRAPK